MTTTTDTTLTANDPTLTDATSSSSTTTAPVITLDQADTDYAPGETVGITATNVAVGGAVTFDVEHVLADGTVASDLTGTGTAWTATDGGAGDLDGAANGSIQTSWYVNDDAANQAFTLSATDAATGATATVAFTDAPKPPPAPVADVGVLAAPTGPSPTGSTDPDGSSAYNNTHWAVLDGATITGTILNATDAVTASGAEPVNGSTVWVEIKSSEHGNTYVEGTYHLGDPDYADNSITFTWTVEAHDGGDICNTTIVAYETEGGFNGGDQSGLFKNTSNDLANDGSLDGDGNSSAGFGIVNADGTHHDVCNDEGGAALTLSKDTVCPEDESHSVNGGTLLVGNKVEWVYTLTGVEGSVSNVTLTDNQNGTDFVIYDAAGLHGGATLEHTVGDSDNVLEAGEVWTFKLTGDVVAGNYDNTATANGTNAATGEAVSGESLENSYFGATPSISIDKVTADLGDDDVVDGTPGDGHTILVGENIQWQYTVTNTGNVDLTNIVVVDDKGTSDTSDDITVGTIASLAVGASTTLTLDGTAQAGDYHNSATASASFTDNCDNTATLSASDDSSYAGLNPHLTLDKVTADLGDDNVVDGTPGDGHTILAGENIQWQYTVTNDGNVDLTNIVVVDDKGTSDTSDDITVGTIASLAVGASTTLTLDGTAQAGDYHNTATATATVTDTAGHSSTASDSDDSSYTGITPHISIDKVTADLGNDNIVDGTPGDGNTILAGENIQWQYTVTNDGDVALSGVTVTDNQSGVTPTFSSEISGNGDNVFDPGEVWLFTANGTATDGAYSNTGTATGTSAPDSAGHTETVTASDDSGYFGANPDISIAKYIVCPEDGDLLDANTAVKLLKDSDGKVEYQIVVTNEGNVDLIDPQVTDSLLALGAATQTGGSGDHTDNILNVGETWTYTVLADWTAGGPTFNEATANVSYSDTAGHTWNAGDGDGVSDSASYFGLDPSITLTKLTNGSDGPDLLQGQAITWTYDVTNDGNVGLTGVHVTDNPSQTITALMSGGYNTGDANHNSVLDVGETWHYQATGTAIAGSYSNIATATTNAVTDDCGDSVTPTATDGSSYTGHARAAEGLTKGYWATHLTLWDVYSGDEKGSGSEINVAAQHDWNKSGAITNVAQSDLTSTGPSSSLGLVKTASMGKTDSGLLMGDLNHDGVANDGHADLFFDLTSAQLLANNSVSGDARIILASQAVAAQLNEYQGYVNYGHDTSPNGLLSEAVQWLEGLGPLSSNGHSNVDTNTANDVAAAKTVINDGAGNDYTVTSGVVTLGGTALSSSDASWQTKAQVFSEATANLDINGDGQKNDTVWANGEGLKNALAAYNHGLNGTAGFVVSTDGSTIGWENSAGGTVTDVHANAQDVFWGILANQGVTGVEWHLA